MNTLGDDFGKAVGGVPVKVKDIQDDELRRGYLSAGLAGDHVVYQMPDDQFPGPELSEEQEFAWSLYGCLLHGKLGWLNSQISDHFRWVINHKEFKSPDEWLGDDGMVCRKRCGIQEPSDAFKRWWHDLKAMTK